MVTQLTAAIVPCEPCTIRRKSVWAGPIGFFWASPLSHCSFRLPGPAAEPVRNTSPVPNTISVQSRGSVMSQWYLGIMMGSRSRPLAITDLVARGRSGMSGRRPAFWASVLSCAKVTPGSMSATLLRRSTLCTRSIPDISTITASPDGTVSPLKRGGPELEKTRLSPASLASLISPRTCGASAGLTTTSGFPPSTSPALW
jgi:hypothetical protein